MRLVLAFPPGPSPTYVPLGLATLVGHLRATVPSAEVTALDLNVQAWSSLAARQEGGPALLDFMRGKAGDFFDEPSYLAHAAVFDRLRSLVAGLADAARACLLAGTPPVGPLADLLEEAASSALARDPEVVGLSVMYLEQVPFALLLSRLLRQRSTARLVLGGAAMTALHAEDLMAACPWVDALALGEGEAATMALAEGRRLSALPGALWRDGRDGAVGRTAPGPAAEANQLPAPDFGDLPLADYWNPASVLPALSSRGCRWRRCRFCAHNASFDRYRCRDATEFAREVEGLVARHGARHVYLADQYVGPRDLERLARALGERAVDVSFQVMGRPAPSYSPALLRLARDAGCRWISWGVESGSQRLLDVVDKGTKASVAAQVLADAAAAGLVNLAMLIFGLPTGTVDDLAATFRFLEASWPHLHAMTASSFVLFEGTEFARHPERYGLQVLEPRVVAAPGGIPIRSTRLDFREVGTDGSLRPPRASLELSVWQARRRWLGEPSFLERLPCEHLLLYAARDRR